MAETPEARIERKVCKYARDTYDFETYKFVSPGRRNVPDRIFTTPEGLLVFIEFKAPDEEPNPGQKRELERLTERGFICFVVDDIERGKTLVDALSDRNAFVQWYNEYRLAQFEGEARAAALVLPASVSDKSH